MQKVAFLVDGFNLYHALDKPQYNKYKWINLDALARQYTRHNEQLTGVYYFTALAHWSQNKVNKHKRLIKALESAGVKVVKGKFKKKTKKCYKCKQLFQTFEEKQTDVNIALKLFKLAMLDQYDIAIILSGDADLIPAVKEVKKNFSNKEVGIVLPIGSRSDELKNSCDFHYRMQEKHLRESQFERIITLPNGNKITRPQNWE